MNPPSVIRSLEESQRVWNEFEKEKTAFYARLSNAEHVFNEEEADFNKRILAGFLTALRPSIEREIEQNEAVLN